MAFSFDRTPTSSQFRVLTVCTGNICRSPMAEQYLRAGFERAGLSAVQVGSAGTMAQDGQSMPAQAEGLVRQFGADPAGHEARYLFEGHVAGADLVFGMAREHRRAVVSLFPRASRVSFTLREFSRLAEGMTAVDLADAAELPLDDVAGRLRSAVSAVAARRGLVEPAADPVDEDVVDPYRQADSVYEESGRQLVPAADVVLNLLIAATKITKSDGGVLSGS